MIELIFASYVILESHKKLPDLNLYPPPPTLAIIIEQVEGLSKFGLVYSVNKIVNEVEYKFDIQNYSKTDYWSHPSEFFANGGDCEDFAIAKYYILRDLGIPKELMYLVVLRDARRELFHAVLEINIHNRNFILDVVTDELLDWADRPEYEIIFKVRVE